MKAKIINVIEKLNFSFFCNVIKILKHLPKFVKAFYLLKSIKFIANNFLW